MHGRLTGARDVRRHVRHVELPNPPPQRERLLYQPQRPTQGSNPGSGPEVSRRESGGSGRASGHPATLGRLPSTLWGSGDPLTVSAVWFVAHDRSVAGVTSHTPGRRPDDRASRTSPQTTPRRYAGATRPHAGVVPGRTARPTP